MLTEENFETFAVEWYKNPNCHSTEEFMEDYYRFKYLKRLFKKYESTGVLKERLILNHIVILYNVFDNKACTKMLFFKLQKHLHILKPFLILINRLPDRININNINLFTSDIRLDSHVVNKLREI
jgi:hypothetical protein